MLGNNDYALIQQHPSFKRIPHDNPLCCNIKFSYTTKGSELAPTFEDYIKAANINLKKNDESKTTNSEVKFENVSSSSGTASDISPIDILDNIWIDSIGDIEDPENDLDEEKNTYTLKELLSLPNTETPFLLEDLIPGGAISILSGDSDGGKTSFYQQLALAIIQGKTSVFGKRLNPKFKKVLLVNTEDNKESVSARLKLQLSNSDVTSEQSENLTVKFLTGDILADVDKFLSENPSDLVCIDAFGDVYEGDTRADNATRAFMNGFVELIRKHKCSILFVHHIGKRTESNGPNKDNMLGSVAIHGKARSVMMLTKSKSNPLIKTLKIVKGNYVSEEVKSKALVLKFDPKTLLHEVVCDDSYKEECETQQQENVSRPSKRRKMTPQKLEQAYKLRQEKKTLREIEKIIGVSYSQISRSLSHYHP